MLESTNEKNKLGATTTTSAPKSVKGQGSGKHTPNKVTGHGSNNNSRSRNWTFLVYPYDSAPKNWRDELRKRHIKYIISPLHDKDLKDSTTGELKKPHYHVILLFPTKKSYKQVKEITDSFNSPIPQIVGDIHMMVRYLAHLDDQQKHQYSISDIETYGDVNLDLYLKDQGHDKFEIIDSILDFCEEKNIIEFQDILDTARRRHYHDWFPLLCSSSGLVVQAYIRSNRDRKDRRV